MTGKFVTLSSAAGTIYGDVYAWHIDPESGMLDVTLDLVHKRWAEPTELSLTPTCHHSTSVDQVEAVLRDAREKGGGT